MLIDCHEFITMAFDYYADNYKIDRLFYNNIPSTIFINYFISEIYMNTLESRGGFICSRLSNTDYDTIVDDNGINITKSRFEGDERVQNLLKLFYFFIMKPGTKATNDLNDKIRNYYFKRNSRENKLN